MSPHHRTLLHAKQCRCALGAQVSLPEAAGSSSHLTIKGPDSTVCRTPGRTCTARPPSHSYCPHSRDLGLLFQDHILSAHLSVLSAVPLRAQYR